MLYPYITFADETEVLHTQILNDGERPAVEVHFERPKEGGFDSARCSLPAYDWILREGYSDQELQEFEQFLRRNAHLLFEYAACGGIDCA